MAGCGCVATVIRDEATLLRWSCKGLAWRSKEGRELDLCSRLCDCGADAAFPWFSYSIEVNVGLNAVEDGPTTYEEPVAIGGLASLAPKELEAVVDIKGPVAVRDAPGFSLSCLFK